MDWIQQWQSKLNKQNGVAPLVRTGVSRHTGLAALPYRNIQISYIRIHHKHVQDVLHQIFFLYHVVNLIYMLSQHPYHHMHLLFFLHSVLLLNNVFPKVPD